jgi:hypothetical protein
MPTRRRPLGLSAYLTRLLGKSPGEQARTWLKRTWAAPDVTTFWRYWNPVYGYVLDRCIYRRLRRVVPRPFAMWLTFVACGFLLHDLIGWLLARHLRLPEMTLLFAIFGSVAVASEVLGANWSRLALSVRIVVNVAWLAGCFAVWLVMLSYV